MCTVQIYQRRIDVEKSENMYAADAFRMFSANVAVGR